MARKSSVHRLPPELKARLDELLAEGGYTLDEVLAHLDQLGGQVSRSALGRYSKRYAVVRERLQKAREMGAAFAQDLGEVSQSQLGRTITELMQSLIFDLLMARSEAAGDEGTPQLESQEVFFLAKGIKELQAAMKTSTDMELTIRADERKRVTADAAKIAETTGREMGLSPDTIAGIKAGILGVKA